MYIHLSRNERETNHILEQFTGIRLMRHFNLNLLLLAILSVTVTSVSFAQNPIIMDQFTADPSARVFNGKVYLYPSHDILATKGHGRVGWFCMQDYHVFSSPNLTNWTDHGVIVSQYDVKWVDSTAYAMWAPDCMYRNGKYYFYFPAPAKERGFRRGFSIGVAVANKPYGPFTPQPAPIKDVHGIDPCVLISSNGQAYLYWAAGRFWVAKLKKNMLELASKPQLVQGMPEKGLIEGPFAFERDGKYYLIYPHVADTSERLEYAIADNPMGPFKYAGVIMDRNPHCWTDQASVIKFKGQWYLFYHDNYLSPHFDKARSVCIDSMFFNNDGTIRKVTRTLRGVGVTNAFQKIQIDRYSYKSNGGASIAFLDTSDTFMGWKTILDSAGAWIQYNSVEFGTKKLESVEIRAMSNTGGTLQIRLNDADGPVIARIIIPKTEGWKIVKSPLSEFQPGIHNLVVRMADSRNVEIDWVSFR